MARFGFDDQAGTVCFQYALGEIEPEPTALTTGIRPSPEFLKNAAVFIWIDSRSPVHDRDSHACSFPDSFDLNGRSRRRVASGVVDQVADHLPDPVGLQARDLRGNLERAGMPALQRVRVPVGVIEQILKPDLLRPHGKIVTFDIGRFLDVADQELQQARLV
ncbi:MAG: hypothetical protein R2845_08830 [Thermomicrobiales bacterium]